MAAANPTTETDICNLALGRIGANQIAATLLDTEDSDQAIQCRLYYAPTRDALLRSGYWSFARERSQLTATTTPDFEWDYAFTLPTDFLRLLSVFSDNSALDQNTLFSYILEGGTLLTDESTCYLRYIKRVTAIASFDALFIEVFVLKLALMLCMPLSEDPRLLERLQIELYGKPGQPGLMSTVRALHRQELNTLGRSDRPLWNNARYSMDGRIDSKMGS